MARLMEQPPDALALRAALLALGPERTPFALEGAAMAWSIAESRSPATSRVAAMNAVWPSAWHPFIGIGTGCAAAKTGHDPPDEPTAMDGYGFQLCLNTGVSGFPGGRALPPFAQRGRGRALWFVTGGEARACGAAIQRSAHAPDLWMGVGTACAFAGDPMHQAPILRKVSGGFAPHVVAGVRFGVDLWLSLGGPAPTRARAVLEILGEPDPDA